MNSKYVATGSDVNTESDVLSELKFGKITVLEIKDGKITDSFETVESIEKEWNLI